MKDSDKEEPEETTQEDVPSERKRKCSSGSERTPSALSKIRTETWPEKYSEKCSQWVGMVESDLVRDCAEYLFLQRGGLFGNFETILRGVTGSSAMDSEQNRKTFFVQIANQNKLAIKAIIDGTEKLVQDDTHHNKTISYDIDRIKNDYQEVINCLKKTNLDSRTRTRLEDLVIEEYEKLDRSGVMSTCRLPKSIEPKRAEATGSIRQATLDYVKWKFTCRRENGKRRKTTLKKIETGLQRYFKDHQRIEDAKYAKEQRFRSRLAATVSREIARFWQNVERVVRYKQKVILNERKKLALDEHLQFLVDQSERYSKWMSRSLSTSIDLVDPQSIHHDNENLKPNHVDGSAAELASGETAKVNDVCMDENHSEVDDGTEERLNQMSNGAMTLQPRGLTLKSTFVLTPVPLLLKHQLREYQHVGLDWLARMYDRRLNGILADEMGLGKTIQTIALLAHLAYNKGVWGPHLIVVPTSVILNWELEFKKWCPALKIVTYYGSVKERKEKRKGWSTPNSFHVCITSYQLALQDSRVFRRKKWKVLILDEAQNIKNFKSQRWQCLLHFVASRRFLLTGTPLQNNLMELWSLMHFLMPHMFASHEEFKLWFSNPLTGMIEGNESVNEGLVRQLHQVLRPFILRRLKSEVEKQMPKKVEHVIHADLSKRQRFLYDDFMNNTSTRDGLSSGQYMRVISILMQLRKVCNHPDLFEPRPVISPFVVVAPEFHIPKLVLNDPIPLASNIFNIESFPDIVKYGSFDFTRSRSMLLSGASYDAETLPGLLRSPSIEELEELDSDDDAPDYAREYFMMQIETMRKREQAGSAQVGQLVNAFPVMKTEIYLRPGVNAKDLESSRKESLKWSKSRESPCFVMRPVYGKDLLRDSSVFLMPRLQIETKAPFVQTLAWLDIWNDVEATMHSSCYFSNVSPSKILRNLQGKTKEVVKKMPRYIPAVYASKPANHETASWLPPLTNIFETSEHVDSILQFPDLRYVQYDCGKLQVLDRLLSQLKKGQHRALIFTQMTHMLDVLERFLSYHNYRYLRLDGSTNIERRQVLVETFNHDQRYFCFILSTRSGGLGLNLTGADTVIFYDSDWNPTTDAQAQDRCHRIGQTRDVHIYRLICRHTVEENIIKKATEKRILGNVAIDGIAKSLISGKIDIRSLFDLSNSSDGDESSEVLNEPEDVTVTETELHAALEAAEDDDDKMALCRLQAEVNAEQAEFVDDQQDLPANPSEEVQDDQDKIDLDIILSSLNSIEQFAVNFIEDHKELFAQSKTLQTANLELSHILRECDRSRQRADQEQTEEGVYRHSTAESSESDVRDDEVMPATMFSALLTDKEWKFSDGSEAPILGFTRYGSTENSSKSCGFTRVLCPDIDLWATSQELETYSASSTYHVLDECPTYCEEGIPEIISTQDQSDDLLPSIETSPANDPVLRVLDADEGVGEIISVSPDQSADRPRRLFPARMLVRSSRTLLETKEVNFRATTYKQRNNNKTSSGNVVDVEETPGVNNTMRSVMTWILNRNRDSTTMNSHMMCEMTKLMPSGMCANARKTRRHLSNFFSEIAAMPRSCENGYRRRRLSADEKRLKADFDWNKGSLYQNTVEVLHPSQNNEINNERFIFEYQPCKIPAPNQPIMTDLGPIPLPQMQFGTFPGNSSGSHSPGPMYTIIKPRNDTMYMSMMNSQRQRLALSSGCSIDPMSRLTTSPMSRSSTPTHGTNIGGDVVSPGRQDRKRKYDRSADDQTQPNNNNNNKIQPASISSQPISFAPRSVFVQSMSVRHRTMSFSDNNKVPEKRVRSLLNNPLQPHRHPGVGVQPKFEILECLQNTPPQFRPHMARHSSGNLTDGDCSLQNDNEKIAKTPAGSPNRQQADRDGRHVSQTSEGSLSLPFSPSPGQSTNSFVHPPSRPPSQTIMLTPQSSHFEASSPLHISRPSPTPSPRLLEMHVSQSTSNAGQLQAPTSLILQQDNVNRMTSPAIQSDIGSSFQRMRTHSDNTHGAGHMSFTTMDQSPSALNFRSSHVSSERGRSCVQSLHNSLQYSPQVTVATGQTTPFQISDYTASSSTASTRLPPVNTLRMPAGTRRIHVGTVPTSFNEFEGQAGSSAARGNEQKLVRLSCTPQPSATATSAHLDNQVQSSSRPYSIGAVSVSPCFGGSFSVGRTPEQYATPARYHLTSRSPGASTSVNFARTDDSQPPSSGQPAPRQLTRVQDSPNRVQDMSHAADTNTQRTTIKIPCQSLQCNDSQSPRFEAPYRPSGTTTHPQIDITQSWYQNQQQATPAAFNPTSQAYPRNVAGKSGSTNQGIDGNLELSGGECANSVDIIQANLFTCSDERHNDVDMRNPTEHGDLLQQQFQHRFRQAQLMMMMQQQKQQGELEMRQKELQQKEIEHRELHQKELQHEEIMRKELQQKELRQREFQRLGLYQKKMRQRELHQRDLQQRELQQRELQQRELQQRELRQNELQQKESQKVQIQDVLSQKIPSLEHLSSHQQFPQQLPAELLQMLHQHQRQSQQTIPTGVSDQLSLCPAPLRNSQLQYSYLDQHRPFSQHQQFPTADHQEARDHQILQQQEFSRHQELSKRLHSCQQPVLRPPPDHITLHHQQQSVHQRIPQQHLMFLQNQASQHHSPPLSHQRFPQPLSQQQQQLFHQRFPNQQHISLQHLSEQHSSQQQHGNQPPFEHMQQPNPPSRQQSFHQIPEPPQQQQQCLDQGQHQQADQRFHQQPHHLADDQPALHQHFDARYG